MKNVLRKIGELTLGSIIAWFTYELIDGIIKAIKRIRNK